jgi:hypothetical protein
VGSIEAAPSQTLVRYNFLATHADNRTEQIPYASDAIPVRSFFVYDEELPRTAVVLWGFGHNWKLRGGRQHTPKPSKACVTGGARTRSAPARGGARMP